VSSFHAALLDSCTLRQSVPSVHPRSSRQGLPVNRRVFISVMGGSVIAAPLAAEAQPARKSRLVGILEPGRSPGFASGVRTHLADLGWTMRYEARYAEGHPERFPALAADLVRLNVDLLLTVGSHATKAAKDTTATIPIVFIGVAAPLRARVVMSLARPGGNVTGATDQIGDLPSKILQLITDVSPRSSRIGIIEDFTNPSENDEGRAQFDRMVQQHGLTVIRADARTPDDIDAAFRVLVRDRVGALIVATTPALAFDRNRVASLAMQHRLPTIGYGRVWVEAGLLMSYYPDVSELLRQAADYVDRILKGARPADLPVVQPTRFELILNLKTARTLGLTVPQSLLVRADQVID